MSAATERPRRGCLWAPVYDRVTAPLERGILAGRRERLLVALTGVVLDVGAGTGANLKHLRSASRVVAVEPDPRMRKQFQAKLGSATLDVELLDATAEALPLADASQSSRKASLRFGDLNDPIQAAVPAPLKSIREQ